MAKQPHSLPKFKEPPVVETVFGVFFRPQPKFGIARRVLFWSSLQDQFPNVEEKANVEEVRESFGDDALSGGSQIRWEVSNEPPSPRLWAKSDDGRHTIQIQRNALLVNWERDLSKPLEPYIPFDERRKGYKEQLTKLDDFFCSQNMGHVEPTSCFVTYVNHIECEPESEPYASVMERTLTTWQNTTSDDWLSGIEMPTVNLSAVLPDQQGRLHVNVVPGVRQRDQKNILRLELTARGKPLESSIDASLLWIDLGHEWVVRGFSSLTRSEMHEKWGRIQ